MTGVFVCVLCTVCSQFPFRVVRTHASVCFFPLLSVLCPKDVGMISQVFLHMCVVTPPLHGGTVVASFQRLNRVGVVV